MAGVFKRLSGIIQAKTNKVLDKAEDPARRSTCPTRSSSRASRRSGAAWPTWPPPASASSCRRPSCKSRRTSSRDQAKAALSQGNEELAREALTRRAALGEQLAELETQHEQVVEQEEKLVETSQRLQAQVEQFRTRRRP